MGRLPSIENQNLKFLDMPPVFAAAEVLVYRVVDFFGKEMHCAVGEKKLGSAGMTRLLRQTVRVSGGN